MSKDNYNDEDNVYDSDLADEYNASFTDEERFSHLLNLDSTKFTLESRTVPIKEIAPTEPVKNGRQTTIRGLTKSVEELGVFTPIHVMRVVDDSEELEEGDFRYMLLDGLRRMYGALRNKRTEIPAIIWDFDDRENAREISLMLTLYLNRVQKHSWSEVWELFQVLELNTTGIKPANIEFLLQLNPGDAMKLKDVMLSGYEEVTECLITENKPLDSAYKLLQKLRREENALDIEDGSGISNMSDEAGEITANDSAGSLSEDQVARLLEMSDDWDNLDVESADFSELNEGLLDSEHQKAGEKHPVDTAIRQATFQRDDHHCLCCGTGGVAFLGALIYHHKIPIHCGGEDSVENGATICDSCHLVIHIAERSGGKLPMTLEQFNEYNEKEQLRIKKILKYAKIAVEAAKMQGKSKDDIRSEAIKGARHRMPGENLKENQAGFYASQKSKKA